MPPKNFIDLSGMTFGKLTVIRRITELTTKENGWKTFWLCRCSCNGIELIIHGSDLVHRNKKDCGCEPKRTRNSNPNFKHGMSKTKIYRTWFNMKNRCYNPKVNRYLQYGGRGITVCDEWKNSFIKFYEDMGDVPDNSSLERIDVNGNYCKENCRWATNRDQSRNKTNNVFFEYMGKKMIMSDWAEYFFIDQKLFSLRRRQGWEFEEIIGMKARDNVYYSNPRIKVICEVIDNNE